MKKEKLPLGALAGFAAGAVLGMLFAPKKGSAMRKNLIRKGEFMAGTAKDKFDEFLNTVSDKFDEVKKEVY
jgi:gas vesicle protein